MNTIYDDTLISPLLPSSIARDKEVQNLTHTLNSHLTELVEHLNDALFLSRIDELSSTQLDHLSKQWLCPVWRDSWSVEIKRNILKSQIANHRIMGTVKAIKNILVSFGSSAYITEWWQKTPKGKPHTFEVVVDQQHLEGIAEDEQLIDTYKLINYTKPVRSQFTISVIQQATAHLLMHNSSRPLVFARITFEDSNTLNSSSKLSYRNQSRLFNHKRLTNY